MESEFLLELVLILVLAKILGLFSRRIHQPQVVGPLLAGIILGPALLHIIEPSHVISVLADVGVILLMFEAGLETDLKQLRGSLKASLVISVIGAAVPLAGGFILASCFGLDVMKSLFVGVILTATSVSIAVEVLHEMNKLKTKVGTAILGAGVFEDVIGIIMLSVMTEMRDGAISALDIGIKLLKIAGFIVFSLVCGYGVYKLFDALSRRLGRKKRVSIFGLAFCFLLAYLAEQFGVLDVTGAYIAGLVLCNSRAEKYIEEKSAVLSDMFFSPIFSVSVGLTMSFDSFGRNTVLFAALLLLVSLAAKFAGGGLGARICGYSRRESAQIGASMIARGEVAVIVATRGAAAGLVDMQFFSGIIIVIIVTTLIAPMIMNLTFKGKKRKPIDVTAETLHYSSH